MPLLDIVNNAGDPANTLEQSRGDIGTLTDINANEFNVVEVPTNITPMCITAE